jgi:hypothetical protein
MIPVQFTIWLGVFMMVGHSALADNPGGASNLGKVVPGTYTRTADGGYVIETNADEFWPSGMWVEDTNGWRLLVTIETNMLNPRVTVAVGSRTRNSGGGYYGTPSGKFAKFQLLGTNGIILQPRKGSDMEEQLRPRMSAHDFPRWPDGGLKHMIGFFSNSPPAELRECYIYDSYQIKQESDYILNVCAVIYKYETNADYLDRCDLPCVTTKIHLRRSD